MTFRLTQKLAKKLKLSSLPRTGSHDIESAWYGNLFRVGGVQYILLTESMTLFSFLFLGKGMANAGVFTTTARLLIETKFKENGWLSILGTYLSFDLGEPNLLAAQDKSILSSMNGIMGLLKAQIEDGTRDIEMLSNEINTVPFTKNGAMNSSDRRVEKIVRAQNN
jgi:hypothetical protein